MRLYFKQRFFSWLDSYDIYGEDGETLFTVEGKLGWGHRLHVLNAQGEHIATLREKALALLPRFEIYIEGEYLGAICKELSFFRPRFTITCNDWQVEGEWMEWDYRVESPSAGHIATISKELLNWTDTYVIDIPDPGNALGALMVVLAIDAEKCSRS